MAQINIKQATSGEVINPPSGVSALFIGTDGYLYTKDSSGNIILAQGPTGPAGPSGVAGTSGVSGSSGTSGTSPAGGGGAGLVAGSGVNSIQSDVTLTPGASASGYASIALGMTVSAKDSSVIIGANINENATTSVLIGTNFTSTSTTTNKSVMIGSDLINNIGAASNEGSVIIGKGSGVNGFGLGSDNVVIGTNAISGGFNFSSITIGEGAYSGRLWSVAIGRSANSGSNDSSVALGPNSTAAGSGSLAIMRSSYAGGESGIAIGYQANSGGAQYSIAIGRDASASHARSASIGYNVATVVTDHTHVNRLYIKDCPVYADNAAALAAGLVAGQVYRTSTGTLMITY